MDARGLLGLPVPLLESIVRHLEWRCCLRLRLALSGANGFATASSEHGSLLHALRRAPAAATLLQTLARSRIAGYLLRGQGSHERATHLRVLLRLPTVRQLLIAGRVPPSRRDYPVLARDRRSYAQVFLRTALLWHPPALRRAWGLQVINGGRIWADYSDEVHARGWTDGHLDPRLDWTTDWMDHGALDGTTTGRLHGPRPIALGNWTDYNGVGRARWLEQQQYSDGLDQLCLCLRELSEDACTFRDTSLDALYDEHGDHLEDLIDCLRLGDGHLDAPPADD
jgi:hypothetical protein